MSARRLLAPEVVQTSAMDCGPASLASLLRGFGIAASYGRLREACQTDVDGTSLDTLEEVAGRLGLDAAQVMLPPDHLVLPEAEALPALVVVRNPDGTTHFVVAWRRLGPFLQVMDPAVGRRWLRTGAFLDDLYLHTLPIPAETWRDWAATEGFTAPLAARLRALGLEGSAAGALIQRAREDTCWAPLATLDAATRMVEQLAQSGALRRGREAENLLRALLDRGAPPDAQLGATAGLIPDAYWSVRPAAAADDGTERLALRGAVLLRVEGPRQGEAPSSLTPELAAALTEPPARPGRDLWCLLRSGGLFAPAVLLVGALLAAASVFVEVLLFRGLLELSQELGLARQRMVAAGLLVAFLSLLLLVERPIVAGVLRLGRLLEVRLRLVFLEKLPRLGDRYFQSRPISDLAERSHSLHHLRRLPPLAAQLARVGCELVFTTAGLVWLDPAAAPLALCAAALALGGPLLAHPVLAERDLRIRTHTGALGRFYLDALLGLTAVRTHGAERAVRGEHEGLLVEWARAGLRLNRTVVSIEAGQSLAGFALAAWLLHGHLARGSGFGSALLVAYWTLQLPALGQEAASLLRQYPQLRSTTLRLLEPLGAPEDSTAEPIPVPAVVDEVGYPPRRSVDLRLEQVRVRAGGHPILEDVDLHVPAGQHVAVVGRSGAGKSSLLGLFLGWHRADAGRLLVDGEPLRGARLEALRRETAWVDPSVHLWNTSIFANLTYAGGTVEGVRDAVRGAGLLGVLQKLPAGLQTRLGEGGRRVSGGEGQRIRLGRALLQPEPRLVLLDEPFRGLDRTRRRALLAHTRTRWSEATLLCVTHDIADTLGFERVIVVEGGRIVEDAAPDVLLRQPDSRYRELLEQEREVRDHLRAGGGWRYLRLARGRLSVRDRRAAAAVATHAPDPLSDLIHDLHADGSALPA